jgi:S-adenosylmethionine synthetase
MPIKTPKEGIMTNEFLFSSESVSEGHPDKVADQISDAVLDYVLEKDPISRVACETLLCPGLVVVAGEVGMDKHMLTLKQLKEAIPGIVTRVLSDIGYDDPRWGFDSSSFETLVRMGQQSEHIAAGVVRDDGATGAGDQGLMFGYAVEETPELMPLPISLAHKLVKRQAELRKNGSLQFLGPDAKSQVTLRYKHGRPLSVESVLISSLHEPGISQQAIREAVIEEIIRPVIPAELRSPTIRFHVNPTGSFETGGPIADVGLTGRKIIVDTYGGSCPHGGGAFSGKDPTKVDRSAAYAARHVAKSIVAAGLANRCTVQLAYAIGLTEPQSVFIDTHGTGKVKRQDLDEIVDKSFDLSPDGIIRTLDLRRPIYYPTASYGHFGRPGFPWEKPHRLDLQLATLNTSEGE